MPIGPGTTHPFPQLQVQPGSNLDFPWADWTPRGQGQMNGAFGPDGVVMGMVMAIRWEDLKNALVQLVGYSYRDVTRNRRPTMQMQGITGVTSNDTPVVTTDGPHGLQTGDRVIVVDVLGSLHANGRHTVNVLSPTTFSFVAVGAGAETYVAGTGEWRTIGSILRRKLPWQSAMFNQLWVKRVANFQGYRMTGKETANAGFLAGLGAMFGGAGAGQQPNLGPFTGYDIALLALEFWRPPYAVRSDASIVDSHGNPREWLRYCDRKPAVETYMLSRENTTFVWGFSKPAAPQMVQGSVGQKLAHFKVVRTWYQVPEAGLFGFTDEQTPNGLPYNLLYMQSNTVNPITGYPQYAGFPITSCVNTPINAELGAGGRMFGCYDGTLLYDGVAIAPQPLQLPPALMGIAGFGANEPISQVQYDVALHYDVFDPPRRGGERHRGHNLMPDPATTLWANVQSQQPANPMLPGSPVTTPFQYADLSDLYQIL